MANTKTESLLEKQKEKEERRKLGLSLVSQRPELKAAEISNDTPASLQGGSNLSKISELAGKGTNALKGISPNMMGAADSAGQMIAGTVDPQGEGPATIASTALTGASIGSVVPGIGTAIGAVVGLGLGVIKAESNKKQNQALREAKAAEIMGNALKSNAEFRPLRLGSLGSFQGSRDLKF